MLRKHRFVLVAFVVFCSMTTTVLATLCTATNLMLGQLSGSQTYSAGRGGYYYYGTASFSFDCTAGTFSSCEVCGLAQAYYKDPDTGLWVLSAYDYTNSGTLGCSSTGNNGIFSVTYPPTLKLATGANYKVVVSIAPYDPSIQDCTKQDNYTLSSYQTFVGM